MKTRFLIYKYCVIERWRCVTKGLPSKVVSGLVIEENLSNQEGVSCTTSITSCLKDLVFLVWKDLIRNGCKINIRVFLVENYSSLVHSTSIFLLLYGTDFFPFSNQVSAWLTPDPVPADYFFHAVFSVWVNQWTFTLMLLPLFLLTLAEAIDLSKLMFSNL